MPSEQPNEEIQADTPLQKWAKRPYAAKLSGVLRVESTGGECRTIEVEFATMEQANAAIAAIRSGQMGSTR